MAPQTAASASPLVIPDSGEYFVISGTVNFSALSKINQIGRRVTLRFEDVLTISNSGTLKLVGGTFATTANDTLTLICDGSIWYETSRTVL